MNGNSTGLSESARYICTAVCGGRLTVRKRFPGVSHDERRLSMTNRTSSCSSGKPDYTCTAADSPISLAVRSKRLLPVQAVENPNFAGSMTAAKDIYLERLTDVVQRRCGELLHYDNNDGKRQAQLATILGSRTVNVPARTALRLSAPLSSRLSDSKPYYIRFRYHHSGGIYLWNADKASGPPTSR
jgi:hypothetical protein